MPQRRESDDSGGPGLYLGLGEIGGAATTSVSLAELPEHMVPLGETERRVVRWWQEATEGDRRFFSLPELRRVDVMQWRRLPSDLAGLAPRRRSDIPRGARGRYMNRGDLLDPSGVLDEAAVMGFYRRGILEYTGRETVERFGRTERPVPETAATVGGDPFWWVRQQAREMWTVTELWDAWRAGNADRLRELLGPIQGRAPIRPAQAGPNVGTWEHDEWWTRGPEALRERRLLEARHRRPFASCRLAGVTWTGERLQIWVEATDRARGLGSWQMRADLPTEYIVQLPDEVCLQAAWNVIRERIREHLKGVSPTMLPTGDGRHPVRPYFRYSNLLEAAYIHLWGLITNAARLDRCRECGVLFPVLRQPGPRGPFCSTKHYNTDARRRRRHPDPA